VRLPVCFGMAYVRTNFYSHWAGQECWSISVMLWRLVATRSSGCYTHDWFTCYSNTHIWIYTARDTNTITGASERRLLSRLEFQEGIRTFACFSSFDPLWTQDIAQRLVVCHGIETKCCCEVGCGGANVREVRASFGVPSAFDGKLGLPLYSPSTVLSE
jgi:hypothetical protein